MARDDDRSLPVEARRSGLSGNLFEPFFRLRNEVDRLIDDFPTRMPAFQFSRGMSLAMPALQMTETEKAYKLTLEVPGMEPDDIEVTVSDGGLIISGEKKEEREEKERDFLLCERSYGAFERRVELPPGADAEKIKATVRKGVLSIALPKDRKAEQQKKRVKIETA